MILIKLTVRNVLTIFGTVLGGLLGLWLLTKVWHVLLLAFIALLIAAALLPYVEWLRRRTGSRTFAVLLVVFAVLAAVGLVLVIVVPPMVRQGQDLWDQAPELQARVADFASARGWHDLAENVRAFQWSRVTDRVGDRLVSTGRTVVGMIFAVFTVFMLSAYLMLDARRLKGFLYFSTPRPWHRHIRALLPALQRVVGGYIRGQAITSGAIFVFTFGVLTVMDVPNAIALAAIAAILDLVPLVGVYLLVAVVALPALVVSTTTAGIVVGAMVLYQQFEDRVLIPRVYGATLRLPTIAVVLSLLLGTELLGIAGALLALPVAAGIRVLVEYFADVRTESPREAAAGAAPEEEPFAPGEGAAPVPASEGAGTGG